MKSLIVPLLFGFILLPLCNGEELREEVTTKEVAVLFLQTRLYETKQLMSDYGEPQGALQQIENRIQRLATSIHWKQLDQVRGDVRARQVEEEAISSEMADIVKSIRKVQKQLFKKSHKEWAQQVFKKVSPKQLDWNGEWSNWSVYPNKIGGQLQREYMSIVLDIQIKIIEAKCLYEKNNLSDSPLKDVIDSLNRMASSDNWRLFWSPKTDVVARTKDQFDASLQSIESAIREHWLLFHPELKAAMDKGRQETLLKNRMAEIEAQHKREIADAKAESEKQMKSLRQEYESEISSLNSQMGSLNSEIKRTKRQIQDAEGEIEDMKFRRRHGIPEPW